MKPNFPNFLIVGAAKAGTTSLYNYLDQHPDIFMSHIKEPCFFSFASENIEFQTKKAAFITRPEDYLALFDNSENCQCRGEASTPYLYLYEKTIHNIKKYVSGYENIKIVIVLRNPVHRAYSQYMMLRRDFREDLTFEEAIKEERVRIEKKYHFDYYYIDRGFYFEQVKAYLENFKYVKIYLYEDIRKASQELMKDLFEFLHVDKDFTCNTNVEYNVSGIPRLHLINKILKTDNIIKKTIKNILPEQLIDSFTKKIIKFDAKYNLKKTEMSETTKQYLITVYKEDIKKLSGLINKDLTAWLN